MELAGLPGTSHTEISKDAFAAAATRLCDPCEQRLMRCLAQAALEAPCRTHSGYGSSPSPQRPCWPCLKGRSMWVRLMCLPGYAGMPIPAGLCSS